MRIGLFDSGVGGLTVLKEIRKRCIGDDYIYLADTARLPYGNKSTQTILRYSLENSIFLIEQNVDLIVIACNTATTASLETLQKVFKIPVIGIIDPSIDEILSTTKNNTIAVLGTKRTINSKIYEKKITEKLPDAHVIPIACPLLAPLIEEECHKEETVKNIIRDYVMQPLLEHKPDTLVLACTHYPLVQDTIQEIVGANITIIDPSKACAEEVLKFKEPTTPPEKKPSIHFFVSDDKEHFSDAIMRFLGPLDPKEVSILIDAFHPGSYFV